MSGLPEKEFWGENMSRFRNILVHRYWEVDEKKILEYAKNNLEDFEQFLRAAVSYLQMN
jgi:uncharacterized protein YutE (UPF0331/DUF86 family)